MFRSYELNLSHCEAASDLLTQAVRDMRSDVAIVSEPYRSPEGGCWIQSISEKAALWSCGGPPLRPTFGDAHNHFVRAKLANLWIYSCYLSPSLSRQSFAATMDDLVEDARDHKLTVIASDFNAWAQEWGSDISKTSSYAIVKGYPQFEVFATLDVVLLNQANANTLNRIGAGSVINLTFVTSSMSPMATWKLGNHYTASDHEAVRRKLKKALQLSKRVCFQQLCDSADHDPWRRAYKTVVKRPSDPEKQKAIVEVLSPSGPHTLPIDDAPRAPFVVHPVSADELLSIARQMCTVPIKRAR